MKLGVLLDRLGSTRGGAESHTAALLARAVASGDEAVVATLEGSAPAGVELLTLAVPRRRPRRDRVFAAEGIRRLREAGADVVLAFRHAPGCDVYLPHGGLIGDAIRAQDLARGRTGVFHRVRRLLSSKVRYFFEAEQALLGGATGPAVIAVSRWVAARIGEVYPAARDRVTVIPNGVDTDHLQRGPFEEAGRALRVRLGIDDELVGLLLAHDPVLKGAEVAIRALAEPRVAGRTPGMQLLVAGARLPASLRRLARRLRVGARLHVLGPVDDPRPLFAAADVLVHPTWHDPCSLACLEALAMSLPVITTPLNGVREIMGMRGGIVLEAAGDPEALAVALDVLSDPALRAATADDARYVAELHRLHPRLDDILDVCRAAALR